MQARNHYRAYTRQDAGEITYQLAREPMTKTARRLGRTLRATFKYMRRTQPVNMQEKILLAAQAELFEQAA